jgi:SOS-response transcriptional repressor LexA
MATQRRKGRPAGAATPAQFKVFRWIATYYRAHGYMPSLREACVGMRFASHTGVRHHLLALERLGWVQRDSIKGKHAARTLKITRRGQEALRVA